MGNQAVLGRGRTQGPEDFKEAGICTRVSDQGAHGRLNAKAARFSTHSESAPLQCHFTAYLIKGGAYFLPPRCWAGFVTYSDNRL